MAAYQYLRRNIFDGKVAIVTGGGSGMGEVIAEDLAALGCTVVIASRNEEKLVEAVKRLKRKVAKAAAEAAAAEAAPTATVSISYIACNIRNEDHVNALVAGTLERHGRLDILVNNGGGQFPSSASGINKKGFNAVVETNLTGTFLMYGHRAALSADVDARK